MIQPGIVLSIDREYVDVNGTRTGQISALLQTGEQIEACYAGTPPWPLATALFEGPGEWFCLGPIGDQRTILHDDFLFYGTSSIGDTEWIEGGTGSSAAITEPVDGAGVVRLTATATSNIYWIRKRDRVITLPDDRAFWLSARIRPNDVASDQTVFVGLASADEITSAVSVTKAGVYASLRLATNTLRTTEAGSPTIVTTGENVADDTWAWVDLLVVGGQWAAMWVDGSGPWVSTTNVPSTASDGVTPFVMVLSAGGTVSADIDCISLAAVSPVNTPDDVAIPAVPFLP